MTESGDTERSADEAAAADLVTSAPDPAPAGRPGAAALADYPAPDPSTAYRRPAVAATAAAPVPWSPPSPVGGTPPPAVFGAPTYEPPPGHQLAGQPALVQQPVAPQPHAYPAYGQPPYGSAAYGQQSYGQQPNGYPAYGQPTFGQPAIGQTSGPGGGGPGYAQPGFARYPAFVGGPPVPRRRSGRTASVVLATVATVTAVVVGATVVVPRVLPGADARRTTAAGAPSSAPAAGGGSGSREVTDTATRAAAIDRLLAARGAAVTKDDAKAWKATQLANATAPAFSRLAVLPITVWRYEVDSIDSAGTDSDVNLAVRVRTRYDVDTADAIVSETLTLRHGASGWRVATETTDTARLQPWDLGTLSVVRGTRSLVIGIDQRASVLRSYARIADSVTPDVTAVWGTDWNQHPVVIVPKSVGQLGRALDETEKFLTDFAAVTTGESGSAPPDKTAFRVWTNTTGLSDTGDLGREIVLRHEITHVATAAPDTPSVPLWLEEGFAEYVGYSTTSVPERSAWSELVTAVRNGSAPTTLPDEDAFHAGAIDLAYESSDLACRLVAQKYGRAALVRLYRLVRSGTGSEAANLEAALVAVTGSGTAAFVKAWRARMAALR